MPKSPYVAALLCIVLATPACQMFTPDQKLTSIETKQNNDRRAIASHLGDMESRLEAVEREVDALRQGMGTQGRPGDTTGAQGQYQPGPQYTTPAQRTASRPASPPATSRYTSAASEAQSGQASFAATPGYGAQPAPANSGSLTRGAIYGGPVLADAVPQRQQGADSRLTPSGPQDPATTTATQPPPESGRGSPPPGLTPLALGPAAAPRNGPEENKAPPAAAAPAAKQPPAGQQAAAPPRQNAKAAYESALALYYKGQYDSCQKAFTAFIEEHPGSSLVPNALYWKGECLYSLGKFADAILSFKDVAGKFPKHDKAAASLLKAGYAYAALNDNENARFYWQLLVDDFPDSNPAGLARKRLGGN